MIVLFFPARNEAPRVGAVIDRAPERIGEHEVAVIVVDDGSTDGTAAVAVEHGAKVVEGGGRGLGNAVRVGLADAVARGADAVAFCDADGEYDPAELEALVAPILVGGADYVVGSRFAGRIRVMHANRRFGNRVLTLGVRALTRLPVTDGQSGYRALSREAAEQAHLEHDFNYAQVLTIDLWGKGFRYAEVPISYSFRESGKSFVRLLPYLRRVLPAVRRSAAAARSRRG